MTLDDYEARAPRRRSRVWLTAALLTLVLALGLQVQRWQRPDASPVGIALAAPAPTHRDPRLTLIASAEVPNPDGAPRAHASTLAVLPGNEMLAFWWAGSRESGPDVKVYSSVWRDGHWHEATALFDRQRLGRQLGFGVRRLGNPTAWVAGDGTVHLYVVATGLGGWAAGRVAHLTSSDRGRSFTVKRMLPFSPLWNTSVLVRTSPVALSDGGWWLPAYFELGNKYSLAMSFDAQGEPRALTRIGTNPSAFQPAVVATAPNQLRAWMRVDRVVESLIHQAISVDGGHRWDDLPALPATSQYSSVAALRLQRGGYVLLHNDAVQGSEISRARLRLMVSNDAEHWDDGLIVAESANPEHEFSYPSVQQIGDELHVSYTDQRSNISHRVYRIDYGSAG